MKTKPQAESFQLGVLWDRIAEIKGDPMEARRLSQSNVLIPIRVVPASPLVLVVGTAVLRPPVRTMRSRRRLLTAA
jgi:hypothetical protein